MKTIIMILATALISFSALAELTPEQARADIKSLLPVAVTKGQMIEPGHRYNGTLSIGERSYNSSHRDLEVMLSSPTYQVNQGLFRENGSNIDNEFLVGNQTYMINRTESTQGALTVVKFSVRNKYRRDETAREYVSKEELTIMTRADGRLVRVVMSRERNNERTVRTFEPKDWTHPSRM